jgi:hypothetical protein
MNAMKTAIALGIAGTLAIAATPGFAAPLHTSTATVKSAAPERVTDVQWRRHHRFGPGVAAGAIIGGTAAIIAGAATAPRYYGPGYYEAPVASYGYDDGYYAAPRYYAPPAMPWGPCYTDEGYGRVGNCNR